MRKGSNPVSLANLSRAGRKPGVLNQATRDLRRILDRRLFARPEYWRGLVRRIEAGEAAQQECLLLQMRYGRPRMVDEDDLPFAPTGEVGPQIVFNIPRPVGEMSGRVTVVGAVRMDTP